MKTTTVPIPSLGLTGFLWLDTKHTPGACVSQCFGSPAIMGCPGNVMDLHPVEGCRSQKGHIHGDILFLVPSCHSLYFLLSMKEKL